MRFRGHMFAAALTIAALAGVVKAALFGQVLLTRSSVLLVLLALGVAVGLAYFADSASHRLWTPTRDTVRETAARKEALSGAVAMAAMFSIYGWTTAVVAHQPIAPTSLLLDVTFFFLGAAIIYALYRHLSTR